MKYNKKIYKEMYNWLISYTSKALIIINSTRELKFICDYINDVMKVCINYNHINYSGFPICISLNYDRDFKEIHWAYLNNEHAESKKKIINFYTNHYENYIIRFFDISNFYYDYGFVEDLEVDFNSILGDL